MVLKDSDQTDEKQSKDALPGLQQPKVLETLVSSSSFCPSDFFVTSESLRLDSHVSSSLDGSHGRLSSESSRTFGGSHWKKKQFKATYQKPFKLRTECLVKPAVKEITRPVDLVLHSDVRAVKRAEFDQQVAEKMSLIEQYREERERQQKLAEEEEIKRLRKELIPRAQLMPYFDKLSSLEVSFTVVTTFPAYFINQVDEALHHTQRAKVPYTSTTQEHQVWHVLG
ncbi:hypothetical protein HYC85_030238 [Camellia sinensis]|uniref:TPX2 C-terminal domain-containing protein n=1 Tax=Camellia sinensis TaxID=4442 RepID=A0A7J7G0U5_CAMSI|nr:hypothetical protein HYC85_030238 [Camellia sinensis]